MFVKIIYRAFVISLMNFWTAINSQTPPIIYVSGNGTGDYNCDGTNDHVQINQALEFVADHSDFTTVYLKGTNTYWVSAPVFISSNTVLEGDATAKIKLVNNASWNTQFRPLIGQKGLVNAIGLMDTTNAVHNITIRGFEIDGNRENQEEPSGDSYYNIIKLQNCYNITINNMYLHDNLADAVNIQSAYYGTNINLMFHDNRVHKSGHDGIYIGNSINFEIFNSNLTDNRTDAHIRVQTSNHFKIHNNICGNNPSQRNSGGIGIDIQVKGTTPLNDVEIFNNYIYGKGAYHGIWLWQTKKGGDLNTHRDVHIHHNIISGNQASGIGIFGFHNTLIEYNTIEFNGDGNNRSYTDNVLLGKQSGITFYEGAKNNKIKGFQTVVSNNIIGNSAAFGIENKKSKIHQFLLDNNCIYNNLKGAYKNASSYTDIYLNPDYCSADPTFFEGRTSYDYSILNDHWANALSSNDYSSYVGGNDARLVFHLKSKVGRWDGFSWVADNETSFCINTGKPSSDFTNEPNPNGGRVNIGAFGNTSLASKSYDIPDVHNFIAYPNPSTGLLTISEELLENEYYIYSLTGELLKQGFLSSNILDLTSFSNGVYLLKIRAYHSGNWKVGKIIIAK